MSKKHKQHDSAEPRAAHNAASSIIDKFEALGNHGVWVVLGIAMLMIAFVYWDFITAAKVLLYKDIGSDSINIFYPRGVLASKIFDSDGSMLGFSLETVMGQVEGYSKYDLFSWLMVWGGPSEVAENFAVAEMLKVLITSTLGFFFFRNQSFSNVGSTIGALCFGFSGYIALGASGWYVHSTQVMYVVATLWLIEYALNEKRFYYVIVPLLTVYIANMTGFLFVYLAAALFVYVPIRVFTTHSGRQAYKRLGIVLGLLVIGMALSYSVFVSVLNMVQGSGRAESIKQAGAASTYGTKMDVSMFDLAPRAEYSNIILRAYSNNTMGTGNGFRGMMNYLEAPLLYYGLPMLLFLPFFFVGQDKRTRVVYGILLGAVIMLLVFPWFRFAFWGFNLDYFREYTMLIGAVMLILAIRGLNTFVTTTNKSYTWLAPASALLVAVLPFTLAKPSTLIDPTQKSALVFLILGYGAVITSYAITRRKELLLALVFVTSIDLTLNSNTTINKRDLLTTREIEQGALYGGSSLKAINWIKSQQSGLYRMVKFNPSGPTIHTSLNDAMVQGFNGIVGYSAFHNKYFLRFMAEMGCRDPKNPSDAKWVLKAITRPYLASALGVKYFLVNDRPMGFNNDLFPLVRQVDNVFVHESKVALPLLVAYDRYITEEEFKSLPSGRNDYMLYRVAVINSATAASIGVNRHYDLNTDTVQVVAPYNFLNAALERRRAAEVSATSDYKGFAADAVLKNDAIVVISIPFDSGYTVLVDGVPTTPFIANYGFFGVFVKAGKHSITIRAIPS